MLLSPRAIEYVLIKVNTSSQSCMDQEKITPYNQPLETKQLSLLLLLLIKVQNWCLIWLYKWLKFTWFSFQREFLRLWNFRANKLMRLITSPLASVNYYVKTLLHALNAEYTNFTLPADAVRLYFKYQISNVHPRVWLWNTYIRCHILHLICWASAAVWWLCSPEPRTSFSHLPKWEIHL